MKILLVADHPTERATLAKQIQFLGYEAAVCANTNDALAACNAESIPLIIVAFYAPQTDGLKCCHRIREMPQGDRSIILFGGELGSSAKIQGALDAGADDFLVKPIDEITLRLRLRVAQRRFGDRIRRFQAEDDRFKEHQFLTQVRQINWSMPVGWGFGDIFRHYKFLRIFDSVSPGKRQIRQPQSMINYLVFCLRQTA